ncbi:MAG: transposase [Candidatus Hydrogenedentes bacterium]|nr:transposase [Candidatus Hydrogenedentota bacterium]
MNIRGPRNAVTNRVYFASLIWGLSWSEWRNLRNQAVFSPVPTHDQAVGSSWISNLTVCSHILPWAPRRRGDRMNTEEGKKVEAAYSRVSSRMSRDHEEVQLPKYFDRNQPIERLSGNLPHWRQDGVIYFVTFRLADSLPQSRLNVWKRERDEWLKAHPEPQTPELRRQYHERFSARFHRWLDEGHGSCILSVPENRVIVEEALCGLDGLRYCLDEFVVMPNHVHVLVAPTGDHTLSSILKSWKSFTARAINSQRGTCGALWQKESFDHMVRSPASLERFREYIRNNPKPKAK